MFIKLTRIFKKKKKEKEKKELVLPFYLFLTSIAIEDFVSIISLQYLIKTMLL